MWVKMRYIVEKRNSNGSSRWYWQRPGFPLRRLPDDEVERLTAATTLNQMADAERRGDVGPEEPRFGTIEWAVEEYRLSTKFARLAPGSRRH